MEPSWISGQQHTNCHLSERHNESHNYWAQRSFIESQSSWLSCTRPSSLSLWLFVSLNSRATKSPWQKKAIKRSLLRARIRLGLSVTRFRRRCDRQTVNQLTDRSLYDLFRHPESFVLYLKLFNSLFMSLQSVNHNLCVFAPNLLSRLDAFDEVRHKHINQKHTNHNHHKQ